MAIINHITPSFANVAFALMPYLCSEKSNDMKDSKTKDTKTKGSDKKESKTLFTRIKLLDELLSDQNHAYSMDDIVDFVTRVGNKKTPEISTDSILNYEKVKDRLRIKLINASKNEEMLKTTPHLVFGDLAVVFQIQFECSVANLATTTVTDHILKMWDGVDLDTLFKDAEINCRKNVKIRPMLSLLASMRKLDFEVPDTPEEMYVLTNNDMTNGAAQMLFPENLDQIAEELGTSKVFIIPSSIHECIVVPEDSLSVDALEQMISEVNETTVADEDILSGTLYMYDTDHREYSIAQTGRKCFMSAAA